MSQFKFVSLFSSCVLFALLSGCTSDVAQVPVEKQSLTDSETIVEKGTSTTLEIEVPNSQAETETETEKTDTTSFVPRTTDSNANSSVVVHEVNPVHTLFTGPDVFVNSMRQWQDESNTYTAKAELLEVKIKQRRVRLLKENGVIVLVDYTRLSPHDKKFVREFILYHRNRDVNSAPRLVVE